MTKANKENCEARVLHEVAPGVALEEFCDSSRKGSKDSSDLSRPFSAGGYSWASNGYMLVRVPEVAGLAALKHRPKLEESFAWLEHSAPRHGVVPVLFSPPKNEERGSDACIGACSKGVFPSCPTCFGSAEVECGGNCRCARCGTEAACEDTTYCNDCCMDGLVPGPKKGCAFCLGTTRQHREHAWFLGQAFSAGYLGLISRLPGVRASLTEEVFTEEQKKEKKKEQAMVFTFDGGAGVLMPMVGGSGYVREAPGLLDALGALAAHSLVEYGNPSTMDPALFLDLLPALQHGLKEYRTYRTAPASAPDACALVLSWALVCTPSTWESDRELYRDKVVPFVFAAIEAATGEAYVPARSPSEKAGEVGEIVDRGPLTVDAGDGRGSSQPAEVEVHSACLAVGALVEIANLAIEAAGPCGVSMVAQFVGRCAGCCEQFDSRGEGSFTVYETVGELLEALNEGEWELRGEGGEACVLCSRCAPLEEEATEATENTEGKERSHV